MLEIHQQNDISSYSQYLYKLNIPQNDIQVIEAVDKGSIIGFAIFTYNGDTVKIFYLDYNNDKYLCDGIIRTILLKASLLNIDKAEFLTDSLGIIEELGFIQKGNCILSSIKSVMDGCRNCKNSC